MRRPLLLFLVVAAGYAAGSQLSYSWFGADGVSASFFPAAGVTLAALVLVERRLWAVVLSAAASAEVLLDLAHDIDLAPALGYAAANTVQPLVAALLLTSVRPRVDLARTTDLVAFIACAVVAGPAVGAVAGASTFVLLDGGDGWARFAGEWWVGDGLGVLVIGGLILSLRPGARISDRGRRLPEAVVIAAVTALATWALFWFDWLPLVFVPTALLLVCGFRLDTRAVAVTGALIAFIAAQAAAGDHAYWRDLEVSPQVGLLYLQLALGVLLMAALAIAAEVGERERTAIASATASRFVEIADAAPAMLWVTDPQDECVFLSRGWREFTGQDATEGLGFAWTNAIHPDDRVAAGEGFVAASAARRAFGLDYRLRRADGAYRWVIDSGRPRLGPDGGFLGYVGSVIDAHERKQAEGALTESEARMRTLFSSIDEGYCLAEMIHDRDGRAIDYRFLEINPLFASMTGLEDPVGRTALEMIPDLESHWIETYDRVASGGEPLRFESGSEAMGRWFDVFAAPVGASGTRFALVFKDVTERRRAELALRESEIAERAARRRAELTARVLGEMETREGVRARTGRLVELLVPQVADVAVVEIPDEAPHVAIAPALRPPGDDADALDRLEIRSQMVVPLDLGGGVQATLLLGLVDAGRPAYTPDDVAFVGDVAERVGLLLARARVQEEERQIGLRLQRALLPDDLEPHPAVSVAARYAPASDVLEVGGDWYDAFALPDGRIAVVVGDVVGHGIAAAADMGGLRVALAAPRPARRRPRTAAHAGPRLRPGAGPQLLRHRRIRGARHLHRRADLRLGGPSADARGVAVRCDALARAGPLGAPLQPRRRRPYGGRDGARARVFTRRLLGRARRAAR
jgi:PAS domain S-box-containing protein